MARSAEGEGDRVGTYSCCGADPCSGMESCCVTERALCADPITLTLGACAPSTSPAPAGEVFS